MSKERDIDKGRDVNKGERNAFMAKGRPAGCVFLPLTVPTFNGGDISNRPNISVIVSTFCKKSCTDKRKSATPSGPKGRPAAYSATPSSPKFRPTDY